MTVLERSELEASPLADLHAIANQLGLDGFRRLRKAELIDAIVERSGGGAGASAGTRTRRRSAAAAGDAGGAPDNGQAGAGAGAGAGDGDGQSDGDGDADRGEQPSDAGRPRRRRGLRARRSTPAAAPEDDQEREGSRAVPAGEGEPEEDDAEREGAAAAAKTREKAGTATPRRAARPRRVRGERTGEREAARGERDGARGERDGAREGARGERGGERGREREDARGSERQGARRAERAGEHEVEGVVELLGNGSAFLRVSPPDASDEDVYISAAQVRRCELVSGDRVSGPVRPRRASERYPSLARIDTINGAPAESVAEGTRYEDLSADYPRERLALDAADPTLGAIEWLTPIGRGSRAVIVGAPRAGKTETLLRLRDALAARENLEVLVVLAGVRPEEIGAWQPPEEADDAAPNGKAAPIAAVNLAASAELQDQTVEHAVDTAKRVAARGSDVVVLIDSLDGLHPHVARRVLAAARNLADGGSLTVIATATRPFGGESTVIALDVALASTGRLPALDLAASGTVRPELLVGEDGARAITEARAKALRG